MRDGLADNEARSDVCAPALTAVATTTAQTISQFIFRMEYLSRRYCPRSVPETEKAIFD